MFKPLVITAMLSSWAWAHPWAWLQGSYSDGETQESWMLGPNNQAFGLSQLSQNGQPYLCEQMHLYPEGDEYILELKLLFFDGREQIIKMRGGPKGTQGFQVQAPAESLTYEKDSRGHLKVVLTKKTRLEFNLAPLKESP